MSSANSAILTYHSIDDSGSVLSVTPELFRRQMEALAQARVPVVPLPDVRHAAGSVALTFDDGFASFAELALPVLKRWRFPATVFVVSGYCGKSNTWPTQPASAPRLPLMTWAVLEHLPRAGISLGAHTVSHPDLTRLSPEQARAEMCDCRDEIEQRTAQPVTEFAYPYGAVNEPVRRIAADQFRLACGTRLRHVSRGDNAAELPRLDVFYLRNLAVFRRLLDPAGRYYLAARRLLREIRAAALR